MSKVFCVADVHVGNHAVLGGEHVAGINRRCQLVLDTLGRAVALAIKRDPRGHFVVLGDLFDTCRPSPQIVARTGEVLCHYIAAGGQVHALLGNHDMASAALGDNALAPLAEMGIAVWDRDGCVELPNGTVLLMCPYRPGRGAEWLPGAVAECMAQVGARSDSSRNIALCTHLGVSDGDTAPWLRDAHDSIGLSQLIDVCASHDLDAVFAGNWHEHKRWSSRGVEVVQVGTLCPTGFDNPGEDGYGCLLEWDGTGMIGHHIPGPRFLRRVPLDKLPAGYTAFASLKAKGADVAEARKTCAQAQAEGRIAGWQVLPEDDVPAPASAAPSGGGIWATVREHVGAMRVPPGVDRGELLEACQRYLASA